MLWEYINNHLAESFVTLDAHLVTYLGLSLWLVVAITFAGCVVWRVAQFLTYPARESDRQLLLTSDLHRFLDRSLDGLTGRLEELRRKRDQEQAVLWVRARPIEYLVDAPKWGGRLVQALRDSHIYTLGDAQQRGVRHIRGVDHVRTRTAEQFLAELTVTATHAFSIDDRHFVPDHEVEARYEHARLQILERRRDLGQDLRELVELKERVDAHSRRLLSRTHRDQAKELLASLVASLRRPGRPIALTVMALLFCSLWFALPHVAVVWRFEWLATAGEIGAALALLAFLYLLVSYFVLADIPTSPWIRRPNPNNFSEQRLQFVAMSLAIWERIAPPTVLIKDDERSVRADTSGSAMGPSIVALSSGAVHGLSEAGCKALLAGEIGRLRENHHRTVLTAHWLKTPLRLISHGGVGLAALLWTWGTRKAVLAAGRRHYIERYGAHTVALFPFFAVAGLVALAVTTVRAAFTVIDISVGHQNDFSADRSAARLCGDSAPVLEVLRAVRDWELRDPDRSTGIIWQLDANRPETIRPQDQWRHTADMICEAVGNPRPTASARIRALAAKGTAALEFVFGVGRAAGMVLLVAALLSLGTLGLRFVVDRVGWFPGVEDHMLAQVAALLSDESGRETVDLRLAKVDHRPSLGPMKIKLSRCPLRRRESRKSKVLGWYTKRDNCEQLGAKVRLWTPARCLGVEGYFHRACAVPLED